MISPAIRLSFVTLGTVLVFSSSVSFALAQTSESDDGPITWAHCNKRNAQDYETNLKPAHDAFLACLNQKPQEGFWTNCEGREVKTAYAQCGTQKKALCKAEAAHQFARSSCHAQARAEDARRQLARRKKLREQRSTNPAGKVPIGSEITGARPEQARSCKELVAELDKNTLTNQTTKVLERWAKRGMEVDKVIEHILVERANEPPPAWYDDAMNWLGLHYGEIRKKAKKWDTGKSTGFVRRSYCGMAYGIKG